MKETLQNKEAFENYYSMGNDRSLSKLKAKLMSLKCPYSVLDLKTFQRWSKAFNWQERIALRDINNGKELEKKVDKEIVNSKADYRTLVKKVVQKFEEKLKDNKIRIERPEDLNIMAKLDLVLMGEAPEDKDLEIHVTIEGKK